MQTIKTGIVVALLIAVCYGAFVALNVPDPEFPADIEEWASGQAEIDKLVGFDLNGELASMDSAVSISAEQLMNPSSFPANTPNQPVTGELTVDIPNSFLSPTTPKNGPTTGYPPSGLAVNPPSGLAMNPPSLSEFPALANPSLPNAAPSTKDLSLPSFPSLMAEPSKLVPSQPIATQTNIDQTPNQFDPKTAMPFLPLLDESTASPSRANRVDQGVPQPQQPTIQFSIARTQALEQAGRGELKAALQLLSQYCVSPELGSDEKEDLFDILDALTREVIYSPKHLIEPAHEVRTTDTLASLSQTYHVNPELLALMNGLGDSGALVPGTRLKVVSGPMRANISLSRGELTLFLGDLYAGRFPISMGKDPAPRAGAFEIVDRQRNRRYYGTGGVVLEANDPRNPYGGYWLNLGNDLYIHGTPEMASSDLDDAGCISLAPLDAKDAYSILGLGSQVIIGN